ncbi:MAG: hypothetical protein BMS9Abin05_2267 [Rhodothermia bacterium]|nr:MAG: hypothetical protein BMS9Abin05_2267 [Rhodothermia bacterium]
MSNFPLVSIGLPTYNGAACVERALRSLVDQTYPRLELVVCDDASEDRTADVCASYAKQCSFIRFWRNPKNLGAHFNFVKTLEDSRGKYYLWADQEDWWAPELVSALVAALERDPAAVASMSAVKILSEEGSERFEVRIDDVDRPRERSFLENASSVVSKRGRSRNKIQSNLFIHGLIHRKYLVAAIEAYPGVFMSERQIVCQLALSGRLIFVDEVLWKQTSHHTPLAARRLPGDANIIAQTRPWRRIRYVSGLGMSIIRSRIIPFHRKLYLPVLVWRWFWELVVRKESRKVLRRIVPAPVYRRLKILRARLRENS